MSDESNSVYDIFISYRRSGGFEMAKLVCEALTKKGFKVFLDVEALRSGMFNTQLYKIIDSAKDFILILSPGSLERCENEGDWVREEILRAMQQEKNIVPVILTGFSFPARMPSGLEGLQFYNGITHSPEYFDAAMAKLTKLLQSSSHSVAETAAPENVLVNGKPVNDFIPAEKPSVEIKTNSPSLQEGKKRRKKQRILLIIAGIAALGFFAFFILPILLAPKPVPPIPGIKTPDQIFVNRPHFTIEWYVLNHHNWWVTSDRVDTCYGPWEVQRNKMFGTFRIVDPRNITRCWGLQEEVIPIFNELRDTLKKECPPQKLSDSKLLWRSATSP